MKRKNEYKATNISETDMEILKLGGAPEIRYELCWRGDLCLFKHSGTLDISVAIRRVEDAMRKMRVEYGMPPYD